MTSSPRNSSSVSSDADLPRSGVRRPAISGVGLGYRRPLHREIIQHREDIDFLEVMVDDLITSNGIDAETLEALSAFPCVAHGTNLSIGTDFPSDVEYLERLATVLNEGRFAWYSEHLSLTKVPDFDSHQLLPLWFTQESREAVVRKVVNLRHSVKVPFLLENVARYMELPGGTMSEEEFISSVLDDSGAGLLLDVANVFVNATNFGFSARDFIARLPLDRVRQIHIAGSAPMGLMLIDSHSSVVPPEVWSLLEDTLARMRHIPPISLEWDHDLPSIDLLLGQVLQAREISQRASIGMKG